MEVTIQYNKRPKRLSLARKGAQHLSSFWPRSIVVKRSPVSATVELFYTVREGARVLRTQRAYVRRSTAV